MQRLHLTVLVTRDETLGLWKRPFQF